MHQPAVTAILFCVATVAFGQTVHHVDQVNCPGPGTGTPGDPFCTVQAGVDAAAHGDEVLVAPGTYAESVDLLGKRIRLRSGGGPAVTTLTAGE